MENPKINEQLKKDLNPVFEKSEETDYDLRRRISWEQSEGQQISRRITAISGSRFQQRNVDGLMRLRMGKNWGRRK